MKRFKMIDFWISLSLIVLCTIRFFWTQSFSVLIKSYLFIGGWQIISMIVHAVKGWFVQKGGARQSYHWITAVILTVASLALVIKIFLPVYLILLVISPFLAIHYTLLCHEELGEWKKRKELAMK